jgi:hypothetical protein
MEDVNDEIDIGEAVETMQEARKRRNEEIEALLEALS